VSRLGLDTIGSLFTGYGGLDMAVLSVFPSAQLAWVAEHEPATEQSPKPRDAAAHLLAHRHPGTPNLGDVAGVDWRTILRVDVLTGGFPCQDLSHAGRRAGLSPGTRSGLWTRMADAIDHLRPALVLVENVRGFLSAAADSDLESCPWCLGDAGDGEPPLRALGAVLGDLADLGYDAAWHGLRASDVGATHQRFRVFVLAWPADSDSVRRDGRPWTLRPGRRTEPTDRRGGATDTNGQGQQGTQPEQGHDVPHGSPAADDASDGRHEGWPAPAGLVRGSDAAVGGDAAASDADGDRARRDARVVPGEAGEDGRPDLDVHPAGDAGLTDWGVYGAAIRRWEHVLGRGAPSPTEPGRTGQRLSPRFVEFLMGLPDGWVTDVPGITRADQLRMLGNGVVPQQGAAALRRLLAMRAAALRDPS
jgi:DNA (cytosine-5)-methyltransferase 1